MYLSHESTVSELFALLSILFNIISSPCFAQPLDSNASVTNATNSEVKGMSSYHFLSRLQLNFFWVLNTLQNYILKCTKFQSQQAINQIFLTDVDFLPVIVFLSNYFLKIHYVTLSWLRSKKNKNQREVGEYWLPHFMIVWLCSYLLIISIS